MKKIRYHTFFFISFFFSRSRSSFRQIFPTGRRKGWSLFFQRGVRSPVHRQQWGLWAIMTNIYEFTIWWLYDSRFYHLHAKDVPFREKMALTSRLSRAAYLQPEHLVPSRRRQREDRKSKSFLSKYQIWDILLFSF